jgi:hypothetical protein
VTVESPENLKLVRHIAWATELYFIPGRASWAHIPLPTPVILGDVHSKLAQTQHSCYGGQSSEPETVKLGRYGRM